MSGPFVSGELWAAVEPLLPEESPKPKGGRPRCCDRRALEGIVFVLRSGIGWERLPREVFGCTGMTCWRRERDWHAAGLLGGLPRVLLERLAAADALDWGRASIDEPRRSPQKGALVAGHEDRPEPHGPRPSGLEAPPRRRCPGHAAGLRVERREPSRRARYWRPPSMSSRACAAAGGVPDAGHASSMRTRPATTAAAAPGAGRGLSPRASRGAASSARTASAATAGWSSAPWPGSPTSDA